MKAKRKSVTQFPAGVSRPALRALHGAGFTELHQLAKVREKDLAELHGMGPKALAALGEGLRTMGLAFHRVAALPSKTRSAGATGSASALISRRIDELGDWRGRTLARMRKLIHEADPQVVEEWKWRGTPVFAHDGILCTGESYQRVVKLTFARGALLEDPAGLFNASLDGNVRRAIDIPEGKTVDARAFKALIRAAVALNVAKKKTPGKTRR